MKRVNVGLYYIVGENAENAAEYIKEQEQRMIEGGAANPSFSEDYSYNMIRFRRKASELYGVSYEGMMVDL